MLGKKGDRHPRSSGNTRTSIVAGAALVMAGLATTEAFEATARARGLKVPDINQQLGWLDDFYERARRP